MTQYAVQVGSLLNALLLSFALADRVHLLRLEKDSAKQEYLKKLEESEQMKSRFLTETEKLVEKRTIELEGANRKLRELASVDVLTGISNRRVFNEEIDKEFHRAKRAGSELSLILIDIDFFQGLQR